MDLNTLEICRSVYYVSGRFEMENAKSTGLSTCIFSIIIISWSFFFLRIITRIRLLYFLFNLI